MHGSPINKKMSFVHMTGSRQEDTDEGSFPTHTFRMVGLLVVFDKMLTTLVILIS